jgi:hypothetical protein
LLGDDENQRAQIFNDVREIYDERSQIVHEGYSKYNSLETDEHIQKAGKLVKELVKKFLELASKYSREELNRKLDVAIGKAVF